MQLGPRPLSFGGSPTHACTATSPSVAAAATPAPRRTLSRRWPSASKSLGAVHDARREENDELAARVGCAAPLEQETEQRDVAEEGNLIEVSAGVARVDAADDDRVAVHDQEVGLRFTLQDRRIAA